MSRASSRIGKLGGGSASGTSRSRPALHHGDPRQAGKVGLHAHRPARQSDADRARRIALVRADLQERDAVRRSAAGSSARRRRMTSRPSGPPSSGERGLEVGPGGSAASRVGRRTAGSRDDGLGSVAVGGSRSAAGTASGRRPVADRVLARQVERVGDRSVAATSDSTSGMRRLRRAATSATAIAPVPVPTSTTRSGGAPGGRGRRGQARADLPHRQVDEQLRLGSRDQRPAIDVRTRGRGTPGSRGCTRRARPPRDGRRPPRTGRRRPSPTGRLGMGQDHARPVDAERHSPAAARRPAAAARSRPRAGARSHLGAARGRGHAGPARPVRAGS